ncbi:hypothetical protein AGR6A_pAt60070 [Agrobacterium sp. NCPPB 925]|nr:hypothetical protein AGR6A_pAt60070 [Agrobacterium sp. NCPPB 925]
MNANNPVPSNCNNTAPTRLVLTEYLGFE